MTANEITKGTEASLLEAIRDRLRDRLPGVTQANCKVTDEPVPAWGPSGASKIYVTVSPGDCTFDQDNFAGGGRATVTQLGKVVVGLLQRNMIDQPATAESAIIGERSGILSVLKHETLRALLTTEEIKVGQSVVYHAWEPTHLGRSMLRDQLHPLSASQPRAVYGDGGWSGWILLQMDFGANFDWEILPNAQI